MAVNFAYGEKDNVNKAITSGKIPKDTLIVTKEGFENGMLFYDSKKNLKTIAQRTTFETFTEAKEWIEKYPSPGLIITIQNGAEWIPYVVNSDKSLSEFSKADIHDIKIIDGGTANDI